jgi:hypothetical protein
MIERMGLSTMERWLALLVRYWAFNMSLIHRRGGSWPGFGYRDDEKATLESIAAQVPDFEYYVWVSLVALFYLIILVVVVTTGMNALIDVIGGEQNMSKTPAPLFFTELALDLVVALSVGFPAAMLPAAALVGRWFKVADAALPDRAITAHYFHTLWFQITRVSLVALLVLIPLWIYVPADSRFFAVSRLVLPLLSPAVSALTAAYYFSARLRRGAANSTSGSTDTSSTSGSSGSTDSTGSTD